MNVMVLVIVLIVFLVFLHFSKRNEDIISILLYVILGIISMYWFAQMLYSDLAMPQEWWKGVIILPGFMIILIIWSAIDDFKITMKSFKKL
jgi:prepilin signal peptidase PulO-like enzyme (type II secretory pathway)